MSPPVICATLIEETRRTLAEDSFFPRGGGERPQDALQYPDTKLAQYARRALAEDAKKQPAVWAHKFAYDPYDLTPGDFSTDAPDPGGDEIDRFLASLFPLPPRELNRIALACAVLVKLEGGEIGDSSEAAGVVEIGRASGAV